MFPFSLRPGGSRVESEARLCRFGGPESPRYDPAERPAAAPVDRPEPVSPLPEVPPSVEPIPAAPAEHREAELTVEAINARLDALYAQLPPELRDSDSLVVQCLACVRYVPAGEGQVRTVHYYRDRWPGSKPDEMRELQGKTVSVLGHTVRGTDQYIESIPPRVISLELASGVVALYEEELATGAIEEPEGAAAAFDRRQAVEVRSTAFDADVVPAPTDGPTEEGPVDRFNARLAAIQAQFPAGLRATRIGRLVGGLRFGVDRDGTTLVGCQPEHAAEFRAFHRRVAKECPLRRYPDGRYAAEIDPQSIPSYLQQLSWDWTDEFSKLSPQDRLDALIALASDSTPTLTNREFLERERQALQQRLDALQRRLPMDDQTREPLRLLVHGLRFEPTPEAEALLCTHESAHAVQKFLGPDTAAVEAFDLLRGGPTSGRFLRTVPLGGAALLLDELERRAAAAPPPGPPPAGR